MKMLEQIVVGCLMSVLLVGVAHAKDAPLAVVDSVDLDRYLGKWYEIARYPAWFQRNCTAVTAEYSLRDDGKIKVVNSCRKKSLDGKLKSANGRAKIVVDGNNAKLKVSFFGPFWGDYWILDLDPDYNWAVVGMPSRKYLWILNRSPEMDQEIFDRIVSRLPEMGYDPSKLLMTEQPIALDKE